MALALGLALVFVRKYRLYQKQIARLVFEFVCDSVLSISRMKTLLGPASERMDNCARLRMRAEVCGPGARPAGGAAGVVQLCGRR